MCGRILCKRVGVARWKLRVDVCVLESVHCQPLQELFPGKMSFKRFGNQICRCTHFAKRITITVPDRRPVRQPNLRRLVQDAFPTFGARSLGPKVRLQVSYGLFWTRKLIVPDAPLSARLILHAPVVPEVVAKVPLLVKSFVYTWAPPESKIVNVALPPVSVVA